MVKVKIMVKVMMMEVMMGESDNGDCGKMMTKMTLVKIKTMPVVVK